MMIWSSVVAQAYSVEYGDQSRPAPDAERQEQGVFRGSDNYELPANMV